MTAGRNEISIGNMLLGFVAAAIAVLTVHQAIVHLLAINGVLPPPAKGWSMAEIKTAPAAITSLFQKMGAVGLPALVNNVFWGGLWGALFAAVWPMIPGGAMWLRGLVFGLLIVLVSNWTILPLIKGQPLFAGMVPMRMLATVLIVGGFGTTVGLVYGMIRNKS